MINRIAVFLSLISSAALTVGCVGITERHTYQSSGYVYGNSKTKEYFLDPRLTRNPKLEITKIVPKYGPPPIIEGWEKDNSMVQVNEQSAAFAKAIGAAFQSAAARNGIDLKTQKSPSSVVASFHVPLGRTTCETGRGCTSSIVAEMHLASPTGQTIWTFSADYRSDSASHPGSGVPSQIERYVEKLFGAMKRDGLL